VGFDNLFPVPTDFHMNPPTYHFDICTACRQKIVDLLPKLRDIAAGYL